MAMFNSFLYVYQRELQDIITSSSHITETLEYMLYDVVAEYAVKDLAPAETASLNPSLIMVGIENIPRAVWFFAHPIFFSGLHPKILDTLHK